MLTSLAFAVSIAVAAPRSTTRTTAIRSPNCTQIDPSAWNTRSLCKGVGGYNIVVESDNFREGLAIRSSQGESDLNLFKTVSAAPSHLGDDVEWILSSGTPVALMVSLHTDSNPNIYPPGDLTGFSEGPVDLYDQSILVIIKLSPSYSCVVNKVDATNNPKAIQAALLLARKAQEYGCL